MTDYDVTIIGGGIHGVGVAQAAAVRGYKTLLIEQFNELAQGTSSRSSKLIHGGLRYLEQFNIGLVRECLLERSYLLNNAPELVKLKPVYIPIYKNSSRPPWMIRAGLSIYALLGNLARDARFKSIAHSQWETLHGLDTKQLLTVLQYYEAQTDDRLLTQAVMRSAQEHGAELRLNTQASAITLHANHVELSCASNNESSEDKITSRTVINAAGPWAANVLNQVQPQQTAQAVDLVQGSHIVVPVSLGENIFYLESPVDHRPVFVMPWYGDTMIGTTESLFTGDPAKTVPLDEEVDYLLKCFQHYFPAHAQGVLEVKHKFSGLRVLPASAENANQRSRDTLYIRDRDNKPRLLSIFGGKLTAYRATAEQVMQHIKESLPETEPEKQIDTKRIRLS